MKQTIKIVVDCFLTGVVYFLGGLDVALQSLLVVMIIDYITGLMSAIYNKEVNSKTGLKGIIKKFGYLLIVALSVIIDKITGTNGTIRTLVIYFFVANDGISILENLGELNVPLPKKLLDTLEQLKNKGE